MSEVTRVRLAAGQAVLLYPGDAHAPRRAASCPVKVMKIVVKVAIPGE
jgi:beta-galactosidase beta subunit